MEIAVHESYATHVERLRWLLHECPDWGRLWPHARIRFIRLQHGYKITIPVGMRDDCRDFYVHKAPKGLGPSWITPP